MAIIFMFSNQGHEVSSGQSMGIVKTVKDTANLQVPEKVIRKSAHVLLYLVLGALVYNVAKDYPYKRRTVIIASIAFVCLYATSDEIHQYFVGGRSAEVGDVLLDTTAGGVGIGSYALVARQKTRKDTHETKERKQA